MADLLADQVLLGLVGRVATHDQRDVLDRHREIGGDVIALAAQQGRGERVAVERDVGVALQEELHRCVAGHLERLGGEAVGLVEALVGDDLQRHRAQAAFQSLQAHHRCAVLGGRLVARAARGQGEPGAEADGEGGRDAAAEFVDFHG